MWWCRRRRGGRQRGRLKRCGQQRWGGRRPVCVQIGADVEFHYIASSDERSWCPGQWRNVANFGAVTEMERTEMERKAMHYGFAKPGPDDFGGTQRVGQCDVQTGLCIPAFGNDVVVRELHSAVRVEGLSRNEYVDDRGFGDDRHGYFTQLNVVVLAEGCTVERLTCECFDRKKQLPVCLPVPTVVAARRRVCAGFGRGVGEPNLRRGGSALDGVVNHIRIGAAPAVLRRVVVGARMDAARLASQADDRAFAEPPTTWGRGRCWVWK